MATAIHDSTPSSDAATRRGLVPDVLPSDREMAYVLWSTTHGQNAADVARELGLPETTVRSWCQRDAWRARFDQERTEQSLRVRAMADVALMRVVPRVIERLERIAMGEGDVKPNALKDGTIVEVEQIVPPQASVNACNSLLDRFGITAIRLHQHQVSTTPSTTPPTHHDHSPAPDLDGPLTRERAAAMSPAERQAWEQARRQRQTS